MIIRIIDTETTGFPPDCKVVEVATLDLVLDQATGQYVRGRSWSSLINPGIPIPPDMSAIHHITDDMVKDAPTIDQVMNKILLLDDPDLQSPNYFAAHVAKFDRATLGFDKKNDTTGPFALKWICSYKCAVSFWPDAPNFKNQTLRYYLGLKLSDPAAAIPHRAAGDVYVTGALIRRMLSSTLTDNTKVDPELLVKISESPVLLPRLFFGKHATIPCSEIPIDYWDWVIKNITDDEDVLFTARTWHARKRNAARNKSPV